MRLERFLTSSSVATLALLPSGFLFTRVYLRESLFFRSAWACLRTSSTLSTFPQQPNTCFLFCLAWISMPRVEASPCHSSGKRNRWSCSASRNARRSSFFSTCSSGVTPPKDLLGDDPSWCSPSDLSFRRPPPDSSEDEDEFDTESTLAPIEGDAAAAAAAAAGCWCLLALLPPRRVVPSPCCATGRRGASWSCRRTAPSPRASPWHSGCT
mmetsp:Transcript_29843/g.63566  ORF Transcript_29843/g.63566 Transcript_29843/m.63566 type:complete len:211 (-) Transcript_29843:1246-1878(-)